MFDGIPPDVPELESDDEFFDDLCTLMEEHREKRGYALEELLFNMRSFTEDWMFTLYMTGSLWETTEQEIKRESSFTLGKHGAHNTEDLVHLLDTYRDLEVSKEKLDEVLREADNITEEDGVWRVR